MEKLIFGALDEELRRWADTGQKAEIWWRDDDAQQPGAELDRLLQISERTQVPLALAVIPQGVSTGLVDVLAMHERVCVLLHGFSHQNHAPENERKMELGCHRETSLILQQLTLGCAELEVMFGRHFLPVLVPPWNRIDARIVAGLREAGLRGLSTLGPRSAPCPVAGIQQINVHVDIINWREGRVFAGEGASVERLTAHLRARREGVVDPLEPTGIMSHHLVHDAACWKFLDQLFEFLAGHPEVRVVGLDQYVPAL